MLHLHSSVEELIWHSNIDSLMDWCGLVDWLVVFWHWHYSLSERFCRHCWKPTFHKKIEGLNEINYLTIISNLVVWSTTRFCFSHLLVWNEIPPKTLYAGAISQSLFVLSSCWTDWYRDIYWYNNNYVLMHISCMILMCFSVLLIFPTICACACDWS